jgi:aspartate aminotransferase-like enzyme
MRAEGVEKAWKRHERLKQCTRRSVQAMGLELLTIDSEGSSAITAIKPPAGIEVKQIRKKLKEDWQIVVADGQADLQGKIFRIGHLGFVCDRDVLTALSALAHVLEGLGHSVGNNWTKVYADTLKEFAA